MSRLWFLLVAVGVLACSPAPPPPLVAGEPIAERDASDRLVVRWNGAPDGSSVFAGPSPDAIDRAQAVGRFDDGRALIADLPFDTRPYLEVAGRRVAERQLPLEGHDNFRDLGGYATSDGRRVAWGRVYRSGQLADLTERDVRYLRDLGLRLVCDFRSPKEREAQPDRLPTDPAPRVVLPSIYDPGFDASSFEDRILSGDWGDLDPAELLVDANRGFASQFAPQFAQMFDRLLEDGSLPMLVHCTGGKDRAGMASALILLSVGVPEQTVLDDYMLTAHYTHVRVEKTLRMVRFASLLRSDPEKVRPLMGVQRRYLEAGFDEMRRRYGSVDAFLRDALGLTDARRARLRELLLE